MPLSYSFRALGSATLIRQFALWKRAGSRPDFPRSGASFVAMREHRVAKYAKHLPHDLLALFVAPRLGEDRQKGVDGVLSHREAELSWFHVQPRSSLVHGGTRQIVRRNPEHQFLARHIRGFDIEHMQPDLPFERAQIGLDVPAVAVHLQDLLRRQGESREEVQ